MSMEMFYSAGTGALFGAALTASKVHLPSVIINQFELTDFRMLQVFAVAMGSSAAIMLAFEKLGLRRRPVRTNTPLGSSVYGANLLGGAMVGVGMALSGACPGTVLVQIAQGISSAKATAIGAVLGGTAYVRYQHLLKNDSSRTPTTAPAARTISDVSGIPEAALYLVLGVAVTGILHYTSASGGGLSPITPMVGGLLIGAAQGASLLLASRPLGASGVYEQLGRYILHAVGDEKSAKPASPPRAIVFAAGIIAGSMVLARYSSLAESVAAVVLVPTWQAVLGGFVMAFGANTAGGCTSGHGLSGLSALSFSSLVTVAAMFGAAILTRLVL